MMEINKKCNKEIRKENNIVVIMGQFCNIEDVAKLICTDFRDSLSPTAG